MWSTDGCPCTLLSPKIARIAINSIESKLCSLCLNMGYLKIIFCRSLWIDAFGFHTKWRKDLEVKSWKCLLKYNKKGVATESAISRLSLRQFSAAFIILITGYLVAFVAFILERCFLMKEVIVVWWWWLYSSCTLHENDPPSTLPPNMRQLHYFGTSHSTLFSLPKSHNLVMTIKSHIAENDHTFLFHLSTNDY